MGKLSARFQQEFGELQPGDLPHFIHDEAAQVIESRFILEIKYQRQSTMRIAIFLNWF